MENVGHKTLTTVALTKTVITVIATLCFMAFILILATIVFICRYKIWSLRYRLAKYLLRGQSASSSGQYIFDGFVSYSSADEKWVIDELVQRLEKETAEIKNPIKLCVHERDFKIGLPIAENIVLCLQQSLTCILVLTKDFPQSYWCNFEANVAHQMFIEQNRLNNLVSLHFKIVFTPVKSFSSFLILMRWQNKPESFQVF